MTVIRFRSLFGESVRLGELLSGSVVLPTVIAHANTLWSLTLAASAANRPLLGLLAAMNATYAGWMALEMGDDHTALHWSRTAVRVARMTGHADLLAYTLI